jgi:hypothetical protein
MIHVPTTTRVVCRRIIMEDEAWLNEIQSLDVDDLDQWEHLTRTLDNPSFLTEPSSRDARAQRYSSSLAHHGVMRGASMEPGHTMRENASMDNDYAGDNRTMGREYSSAWPTATTQASTWESNHATNSHWSLQSSNSHGAHFSLDVIAALAAHETEPIPWPAAPLLPHDHDGGGAPAEMGRLTLSHFPNRTLHHHFRLHRSSVHPPPLPMVADTPTTASGAHHRRVETTRQHHDASSSAPFHRMKPPPDDGTTTHTTTTTNAVTMGPPLTAYNYYFRNERDTIVRGMRHAHDPIPPSDEDYSPAKKAALLHQHWYVC